MTAVYGGRIYKGRKRKRFCISWAFDIQGKQFLEKFSKEIGFRIPEKIKKLEYGIRKMKRIRYGINAEKIVLRHFNKIYEQQNYVTKHDLKNEIKRSRRAAEQWLVKLKRMGFIERLDGNEPIGIGGYCKFNGRKPTRFVLTEAGANTLKERDMDDKIRIKACPKYETTIPYSPW